MMGRPWFRRLALLSLVIAGLGWIVHAWHVRAYPTLVTEIAIAAGILYWSLNERIARLFPIAQKWRVSVDARGIVFQPNWFRVLAFMAAIMCVFWGFFILCVLYMLGMLAAPGSTLPTDRGSSLLRLMPVFGLIWGGLALYIGVSFVLARGNTGSLIVGCDGVTLWSRRSLALSWADVRNVKLIGRRRKPESALLRAALMIDGKPKPLKLALNVFPQDSAVLEDVVRFYWLNPSCRDELGTDLALARWKAKNFAPQTNPTIPYATGSGE